MYMDITISFITLTLRNGINFIIYNKYINHSYTFTLNKFNIPSIKRTVTTNSFRSISLIRLS